MNDFPNKLLLEIPVIEIKEYQKGILGILSKVELDSCDESLKKDLKSVYRLLSLLLINDGSASQSTQAHHP